MQIHESGSSPVFRKIQRAQIESDFQSKNQNQIVDKQNVEEKVAFSGRGLERARMMGALRNEAALLPDLREEKLAAVQEKISSGFYQTPEFGELLADRLSDSPMVRIAAREAGNPEMAPQPQEYRPSLMDEVGDKLKAGFYSDSDVMNFVADRLSDIYGISDQS